MAYHPESAVAPDGSLLVTWEEAGGGPRRVRLARGTAHQDGSWTFAAVTAIGTPAGVYPRIATTPTHAVVAWTSRGAAASSIAVQRVAY